MEQKKTNLMKERGLGAQMQVGERKKEKLIFEEYMNGI